MAATDLVSLGTRHVVRIFFLAAVCIGNEACGGSAWTARVCTSNVDGNCRAVDNGQPHRHPVNSADIVHLVNGLNDIAVREPACANNGIGEVDVNILDHDHLDLILYCLVDKLTGTMTLPPNPADAAPPPPDVPGPRSTSGSAPH
jgi:hypothetical protein